MAKTKKKEEEVRIIHHFADGTESDTLEGHELPEEIQIRILQIMRAAEEKIRQRQQQQNMNK